MRIVRSSWRTALITLCLFLLASSVQGTMLDIRPPSQNRLDLQWLNEPSLRKSLVFNEIMQLIDAGDLEQAKQKTALYLREFPQDPAGLEIAALILIQMKDLPNAELSLRESLKFAPQRLSARAKLGVVLVARGRLEDGEHELQKVLSENPKDALSHLYLGWVKRDQGDLPAAIHHFESYFRYRDPPSSELEVNHLVLGQLLNTARRYQDTVNLLSRIDPGHASDSMVASANLLVAVAFIGLDDSAKARDHVSVVQKLLPSNDPRRRLIEAQLARLDGKTQESRALLEEVLRDTPEFASTAHYELAKTSLAEGKREAATADIEACVERCGPGRPSAVVARSHRASDKQRTVRPGDRDRPIDCRGS